jgi:hypothetical protein
MPCAISSVVVWRPRGINASNALAASSRGRPVARISIESWNEVEVGPGWMVFTRIRRAASSLAAARISPT